MDKQASDSRQAEDLRLIDAIRKGDADAFKQLYDRYRATVYRIAWKFTFNKDDALDLTQDVFIKLYKSLDKYQGDAAFRTWLSRVTSNHCIDHLRKVKRAGKTVSLNQEGLHEQILTGLYIATGQDPSDAHQWEEFKSVLAQALNSLSDKHKEVFTLYAIKELSYKEIADAVGCSVGTVMSRLYYSRKKLQEALEGYFEPADKTANEDE